MVIIYLSVKPHINHRHLSQESTANEYCSILLQAPFKTLSNKNDMPKKNSIFHFDILSEKLR